MRAQTVPRRLHPFSWLFVLLTQLRQFALPLIFVVFLGRGDGWELWGALGALVFAAYSLIYSVGFRYQLGDDELVVREGIFHRVERHVPYERVQNVVHRRNLLHRAFGVVELRLESAGGLKPEAVMSVITLADARRVEAILRGAQRAEHGAASTEAASDDTTHASGSPALFRVPLPELVRLGLVSNRGAVVVGALFAFGFQSEIFGRGDEEAWKQIYGAAEDLFGQTLAHFSGPLAWLMTVGSLGAGFFLVLKLLSIVMSVTSFHDFRLARAGERIATEAGLLTRHAASARRDKLQRLLIGESWLARLLGRRWLSCEVAAASVGGESDGGRLRWLAPIATPAEIERLIEAVTPGLGLEALAWRPLHPKAWRRMFLPNAAFACVLAIPLAAFFGANAVAGWALMVGYAFFEARGSARFAAYAAQGDVVAFRAGWLTRRWTVARMAQGQVLKLSSSPFDRRHGMATVLVDTAGASPTSLKLRVPYLPEAEARALAAAVRARL